ncbi:helix-turn-helix transcriptional regulator [Allomuricauda sp. F6463D]|uniref:helix-turn-helix transcriptional regulator n=1 Tax=Allomuricauda sp. F6463D TaxID=2926409 RepID=UPI001FF1BFB9|nr:YafY family protein [Muricauda sp. F6463D]MCK0159458.1 YafY family transcriptional regulator [Muricauda sp. F6463D]
MDKEKPRLARLTAILTQLQSKRIVTAKDIAEKHNVSVRTVYRDIRTLEKSGIPIVTEEGKGYSVMEGYKIPPVMFTQDEANALITAEQLISKNKDQSLTEQYESAVNKIKSVLKYNQKEKTELLTNRIQVRNNRENEKTSNYLIKLQSTISNYQVVKMDYLSLANKESQREIEPFALYTTQENWVLIAFCRQKKDFRAFRLDCIQKLQILEKHFEPHKMTLQEYLENCSSKYKNTLDTPLSQGQSNFALNQKI